ncbi:MAG: hypothetical protein J5822_07045 [Eubacteriaceae bacterium]|nr:hypothetical protein [Eubacteriaceae bacterium]
MIFVFVLMTGMLYLFVAGIDTFRGRIAIPIGMEAAIAVTALLIPRHFTNPWLALSVWALVILINTKWVKERFGDKSRDSSPRE